MTKLDFIKTMRMWEAKNKKIAQRAEALSVEINIENALVYEEDIATFTNAVNNNGGVIRMSY